MGGGRVAVIEFAVCMVLGLPVIAAPDAPLADAAQRSERARVAELIKRDTDVNQTQADGMTALHWAAYLDDVEMAKLLVNAKADVQAANRYGVTPLSLACANGNEALVTLLLDSGADVNATLRGGETALMTAARNGKMGAVQVLIARGAAVNAKERKGQTALMWAASEGHAPVVDALIKAGADLREALPAGFTPLLFAVREGRADVVQRLLKAGADVNEALQSKRTPGGKAPLRGTSPLIMAVENGHFELAIALVEAGADPNDQRSGYTALHTLTWVRKPNRGDGDDGDPAPAGSGELTSLAFVEELAKRGADVNIRLKRGASGRAVLSKVGATPLLLAAKTGDIPYMRLLIKLGADPLVANADHCTPLMAASGIGSMAPEEEAGSEEEAIEAVKLLLALGADVNAVDDNGETAMHGAAYKNLPKVVALLAECGAKIDVWNRKNKYGWTPLLIAEGHRVGNFKPSRDTVAAIHKVMVANGVTPPPPTPRREQPGYPPAPLTDEAGPRGGGAKAEDTRRARPGQL
jgi:ankyrin repeat protein